METRNLGEADGLSTIEWSQVETQLADLLMHDDPRSPNRSTFWLTTLNADGSPHVTSVGALWHAGSCWFQTGERTRKARNVARDPRCAVSVATKGFDVCPHCARPASTSGRTDQRGGKREVNCSVYRLNRNTRRERKKRARTRRQRHDELPARILCAPSARLGVSAKSAERRFGSAVGCPERSA
jgi:hypothetical protein